MFRRRADSVLPSGCEMGFEEKMGVWRVADRALLIKITFGGKWNGPNDELQGEPSPRSGVQTRACQARQGRTERGTEAESSDDTL